jgi:hypothetical protein
VELEIRDKSKFQSSRPPSPKDEVFGGQAKKYPSIPVYLYPLVKILGYWMLRY